MSMLSRFAAMGGVSRPAPSFVSSSVIRVSGSNNGVTAPSGIQNGDLLVAVGMASNSALTVTPPSGFNVIYLNGTDANTVFIAVKTAASESGNYTFSWSSSSNNTVAILVYRNATRVNTIGTLARAGNVSSVTASSITPTYDGLNCALFAKETTSTMASPPTGMTQRVAYSSNTPSLYVYDQAQAASATSARSATWTASSGECPSIQFQVTNEPSVLPEFVASASKQNTSAASTLVINMPTGTTDGDLMIAVMSSSDIRSWSGDTGWTEVADQATAKPSLRIAYKTAGASEPASYTFTANGSAPLSGAILTYRYAAYDTIAGSFTTGSSPFALASISPSLSQSLLLAVGANPANSSAAGTPISMTARVTDNDGSDPSFKVCDQPVAKGPTGTRSMTSGGGTDAAGIMLAIKPTRSL